MDNMKSKPRQSWTSMFKVKPSTSDKQGYGSSNSSAISVKRPCYQGTSSANEERSWHKTKPRWKPTEEQKRILLPKFESGMVKPSRHEIKTVTAQLQEFGQVEEANVFNWFCNRKYRIFNRVERTEKNTKAIINVANNTADSLYNTGETYSSYVLEDPFFTQDDPFFTHHENPFFIHQEDFHQEDPFFTQDDPFFIHQDDPFFTQDDPFFTQDRFFHTGEWYSSYDPFFTQDDPIFTHHDNPFFIHQEDFHTQMNEEMSNDQCSSMQAVATAAGVFNEGTGGSFSYVHLIPVLINKIPVEVPVGSINVRDAFGENKVLLDSTGQPILVNEWGFTLECLQQGAEYYMI